MPKYTKETRFICLKTHRNENGWSALTDIKNFPFCRCTAFATNAIGDGPSSQPAATPATTPAIMVIANYDGNAMATCIMTSSGALQNCIATGGSYGSWNYPTVSAVSPDGRSVFVTNYGQTVANCLFMGAELVDCVTAFDFNTIPNIYYLDTIFFVGNVAYLTFDNTGQVCRHFTLTQTNAPIYLPTFAVSMLNNLFLSFNRSTTAKLLDVCSPTAPCQ